MKLSIRKDIGTHIGPAKFIPFGVSKESWGWRDGVDIDLRAMKGKKLDELEALLKSAEDKHGVKVLLQDIATWRAALKDASTQRPRTVKAFQPLLEEYLVKVPGHRVYFKVDGLEDVWIPVYVNSVEYHAPQSSRGYRLPPYVQMNVVWEMFEGADDKNINFYADDIKGMSVVEALARKGYYAETPARRAGHLKQLERYAAIYDKIGQQFLCAGYGLDDVDGNPGGRRDSWYWRKTHSIPMVRNGEQARVVMDLFYEEPDEEKHSKPYIYYSFWAEVSRGRSIEIDGDEDGISETTTYYDENLQDEQQVIEIPVHPFVVVFDLAKHLRFRVHVSQLTDYVYDTHLADKLVLSEDRKALVRMLIDMKSGGFKDIVKGKSGGAVVLLAGPPGTGKTLTAEVYSESESRALYSVQCSQLGTDPNELEDELLKVFARARRWNAVMLLDEADVYVHERGNDLQQNAIVGVFLRVLEYQDSVLFLTTNRPEDVDDAIASRCIARLTYNIPSMDEQKQIWRVLSEATGTNITEDVIDEIVWNNQSITGRDVKSLLKLARLLAPDGITPASIEFVKKFRPTL